jgi:hypothetical protein
MSLLFGNGPSSNIIFNWVEYRSRINNIDFMDRAFLTSGKWIEIAGGIAFGTSASYRF